MPPVVLVYHILVLVWVRNARTCMHLASCIPELLIVLLLTVALKKNYLDRHVFTMRSSKIYLCCVAKFNFVTFENCGLR